MAALCMLCAEDCEHNWETSALAVAMLVRTDTKVCVCVCVCVCVLLLLLFTCDCSVSTALFWLQSSVLADVIHAFQRLSFIFCFIDSWFCSMQSSSDELTHDAWFKATCVHERTMP
jgi:hypothetical protein